MKGYFSLNDSRWARSWAHRFRFTLYDGLQLNHLYGLIAVLSYGGATVLTLIAAYVFWNFP